MKKLYECTDRQRKEIEVFHKYCKSKKTNFDEYAEVCQSAREFLVLMVDKGKRLTAPLPLLSLGAIAASRGDNLEKVVTRDLSQNSAVRFEVYSKNRKNKIDEDMEG